MFNSETSANARKKAALAFALGIFLVSLVSTTFAQNVDRISTEEVVRRQAELPRGVAAVARGQADLCRDQEYSQRRAQVRRRHAPPAQHHRPRVAAVAKRNP